MKGTQKHINPDASQNGELQFTENTSTQTHKIHRRDFLKAGVLVSALAAATMSLPYHLSALDGIAHAASLAPTVVEFATVDPSKAIGSNNLSLGFMLDDDWKGFIRDSTRRQLARSANLKVVRVYDYRPQPCTEWHENAKTGTFDWTDADLLVQSIFEIGAEPVFCLGEFHDGAPLIPQGMTIDPSTGLPHPDSFAAYASEWFKHFRDLGLPVRRYEIMNEPQSYFGWDPEFHIAKLDSFMRLFNTVAATMRQQDSNLAISFNFICRKSVLDYWLANGGADVDSLNFNKYDSHVAGDKSDQEMLALAESSYFGTSPLGYSVNDARRVWQNTRGKFLPIVTDETNFNSASENGTDPRTQQMVGAIWTALMLRMAVLRGLEYTAYYKFSSSAKWAQARPTGGSGFGMVNEDNNKPWYPYYVHHMLGNGLAPGDPLLEATTSSEDLRTLAWAHGGTLNILLICKSPRPRALYLRGVQGQFNFSRIDDSVPWQTPSIQTGMMDSKDLILCPGYTVALLQGPIPT